MKLLLFRFAVLLVCTGLQACTSTSALPSKSDDQMQDTGSSTTSNSLPQDQQSEIVKQERIALGDNVYIETLFPDIWMHTSYIEFSEGTLVPSNGLIIVSDAQTIMIDTAWNNAQTENILQWAEQRLQRPITHAIFTHAHQDKMGGVDAFHKRQIDTFAHPLSNTLALERGLTAAKNDLKFDRHYVIEFIDDLSIYFPGPGHGTDNIVVWHADTRLLFGGCLIRPGNAKTLGNTSDGDVGQWDKSVANIIEQFDSIDIVVPSHGAPGSATLLQGTIDLVLAHRNRQAD